MDIVHRIWSREPASSGTGLSLAERLKQLTAENPSDEPESGSGKTAEKSQAAPSSADVQDSKVSVAMVTDSELETESSDVMGTLDAHAGRNEEPAANRQRNPAATSMVTATQSPADLLAASLSQGRQSGENSASGAGRKVFRAPKWGSKPETPETSDRDEEIRELRGPSTPVQQEGSSSAPATAGLDPQLLEQLKEAVERAEKNGDAALSSVRDGLADLQLARQKFEAEIQERIEAAIAEHASRASSPTLPENFDEQMEQKTRQATDHILREVQGQARLMLNAVAGELRSFRDEFGKEIRERASTLDRATQQAIEWKEKLDEALPRAEEVLRSLSAARQEISGQVQSASEAIAEHLQSLRAALLQEIETQTATMQDLVNDHHQNEQRLREEIEKFQREAAAACDVVGHLADHSIERLNAEVEEATGRMRAGLENLATEIEQRILSGGLVEEATDRIENAAQRVVEPAIECIKNSASQAESVADSLNRAGKEVVGRLGAARQEIESRLDALMGEQQGLLEASMSGFHRKAAEELGNLVERVVAQSSQQLDERLQVLCQDLLSATSKQINGAARSTLGTLHQGLKEVFEPETAEGHADSGNHPGEE
jgi:hypothetical protein